MVDQLVNSEVNSWRIAMIENCFGSCGAPLSKPGRVLVGEGVLTKIYREQAKDRQFFLFNDLLVYGNIVIDHKKYNKQRVVPLEDVSLESIDDNAAYQNGWLIRTAHKSFVVYAANSDEKQDWMTHINRCVEELLSKYDKKSTASQSPIWIPDAYAAVCMRCQKTQFTLIVRRHHCRNCGNVVCGPCSPRTFLLPQLNAKPVRVCNVCYEQLRKTVEPRRRELNRSAPTNYDISLVTMANKLQTEDYSSDDSDKNADAVSAAAHDAPRFFSVFVGQ